MIITSLRNLEICELRGSGEKLEIIGKLFGLSRERVRQITNGVIVNKPMEVYMGKRPHSLLDRLHNTCTKTDGCWEWNNSRSVGGYGKIVYHGRHLYAHRAMWEEVNGTIPDCMEVCHKCDNPGCVNPEHLFIATHHENMLDRERKHRGGHYKVTTGMCRGVLRTYNTGNFTQQQVAERYGISMPTVWKILSGRHKLLTD